MTRFRLVLGDITQTEAEAIVNSTDRTLLSGGPVFEAVHRAAGPGLAEACRKLGGCGVGEARLTSGFNLPAPHVIHTVPPTWMGGGHGELENLSACYESSLGLAAEKGFRSIAFPSLGSGPQPQIPLERAAPVVVQTLMQWVESHALPDQVLFVCYEPGTFQVHQRILRAMLP